MISFIIMSQMAKKIEFPVERAVLRPVNHAFSTEELNDRGKLLFFPLRGVNLENIRGRDEKFDAQHERIWRDVWILSDRLYDDKTTYYRGQRLSNLRKEW